MFGMEYDHSTLPDNAAELKKIILDIIFRSNPLKLRWITRQK